MQDRRPASCVWLADEERAGSLVEACSVTGYPAHPGTAFQSLSGQPTRLGQRLGLPGPPEGEGQRVGRGMCGKQLLTPGGGQPSRAGKQV